MSKTFRNVMIAGAAVLAFSAASVSAETMVIATFGDPTPMNAARATHEFEKATGWKIEWRKFASGTDVIAAMASGDVKVAELGSSPLAIAATQGVNLQMFMFDYAIGQSESLIARNGSGIKSLADLKGKRVAVPIGSTSHFSLMGAIKHAGLKPSEVTIMNMKPDQIAAAWQQGTIDAAFIWPPVQTEILKTGKRIVGADQTAEWGYPTFNAWVVNTAFAKAHKDQLVAFAKAMDKANIAYLDHKAAWTATNPNVEAIAKETGATPAAIPETLTGYTFLTLKQQMSPKWMGDAAKAIKETAAFLKSANRIDTVASDYKPFVNTSIIEAALK
ncbi:MAG: taurine ABC transporter substrate-binding protein [Paracoccaceae bacterium]|nr:taurine ABC transporter substrate-binding protein [Paracoccaceae bacterium]MDE3122541.1 taurine ABC transporter substrate-binding protein [Paracoccaceae bacterium]MDE3240699.1 taurine ABC transporter substrate-binding protein [Paracoccaceae bacterium]